MLNDDWEVALKSIDIDLRVRKSSCVVERFATFVRDLRSALAAASVEAEFLPVSAHGNLRLLRIQDTAAANYPHVEIVPRDGEQLDISLVTYRDNEPQRQTMHSSIGNGVPKCMELVTQLARQ